jgi:hypothetical protein
MTLAWLLGACDERRKLCKHLALQAILRGTRRHRDQHHSCRARFDAVRHVRLDMQERPSPADNRLLGHCEPDLPAQHLHHDLARCPMLLQLLAWLEAEEHSPRGARISEDSHVRSLVTKARQHAQIERDHICSAGHLLVCLETHIFDHHLSKGAAAYATRGRQALGHMIGWLTPHCIRARAMNAATFVSALPMAMARNAQWSRRKACISVC